MSDPFIELNIDNISSTPLCCIYRKKSGHRGVDEKKKNKIENDEAHTIYINATCIFGGAEVK